MLGAYPTYLARRNGGIDRAGRPTTPFVVRDCAGATCAYYRYLKGTSMASAHKAGRRLPPGVTEGIVLGTARNHACPAVTRYGQRCEGTSDRNGFYGEGIVNALGAVRQPAGGQACSLGWLA